MTVFQPMIAVFHRLSVIEFINKRTQTVSQDNKIIYFYYLVDFGRGQRNKFLDTNKKCFERHQPKRTV